MCGPVADRGPHVDKPDVTTLSVPAEESGCETELQSAFP